MSNKSFKEFLQNQLDAKPPTPKQLEWASKNFSSMVDPPKDPTPTPTVEDSP